MLDQNSVRNISVLDVYIKIPEEDLQEGDEGLCAKLLLWLYGFRGAAVGWEQAYVEHTFRGFVICCRQRSSLVVLEDLEWLVRTIHTFHTSRQTEKQESLKIQSSFSNFRCTTEITFKFKIQIRTISKISQLFK